MIVCFTAEAAARADEIDNWWSSHHPTFPDTFRDELDVALSQLAELPRSAPVHPG